MKKIAICIIALCFCADSHAFDPSDIRIHGFISQGWLKSDQNNYYHAETEDGTFQFNDYGINFSAEPTDDLRVGMQVLSHDLGEVGNNEVKIDWAYADYNLYNWLGFRFGKMKQVYGLYNQSRDVDAGRTCIFLPFSLYDENIRDSRLTITGASIYGLLPAGLEYTVQYGRLDMDNEGGLARAVSRRLGISLANVDVESANDCVMSNLTWNTPMDGLKLSVTGIINTSWTVNTTVADFESDYDGVIFSMEYSFENLFFAAEYYAYDIETRMNGVDIGGSDGGEGYYGMATYRFNDWFEAGTYYSIFYQDRDDRDGDYYEAQGLPGSLAWYKDFAVTARFDLNENWLFKIEGHHIDGLYSVSSSDGEPSDEGFLFAGKMTFSF